MSRHYSCHFCLYNNLLDWFNGYLVSFPVPHFFWQLIFTKSYYHIQFNVIIFKMSGRPLAYFLFLQKFLKSYLGFILNCLCVNVYAVPRLFYSSIPLFPWPINFPKHPYRRKLRRKRKGKNPHNKNILCLSVSLASRTRTHSPDIHKNLFFINIAQKG